MAMHALGLRSPLLRAVRRPAPPCTSSSPTSAPPRTRFPIPNRSSRNLTRGVLEVLAGVREVDQLARWLTEDAYRKLVTRANLATRARSARGVPASRPVHTILSVRHTSPADGVVEAVVIVAGPARTRAVAIGSRAWTGAGARHPSPCSRPTSPGRPQRRGRLASLPAHHFSESMSSSSPLSASRISVWSYWPALLSPEITPDRCTLRKSPKGKM